MQTLQVEQASEKTLDYYMSLAYPITVTADIEDGGWFIEIKDLPGCMSQADTWDDVLPMITEAKQLWLEVSLEHGDDIPEPPP